MSAYINNNKKSINLITPSKKINGTRLFIFIHSKNMFWVIC